MKLLIVLVCVCSAWGASIDNANEENPEKMTWKYDVTMADLKAGAILEGGDALIAVEDDGSDRVDNDGNACTDALVPPGKIGIKLYTGEFVTKWKAFALHRIGQASTYRMINEIENNQAFLTVLIDQFDLIINYDLCLWKESGGVITSKDNTYRIMDAATELLPGRIYSFFWYRDDESMVQSNRH